ncbi:alpha/beta-hydrolase [Lindgomyces ingoldianus]|uniref:Alpha/beta-hydrolase n=1 Tax=Lindgomyces ingoldianus TaxID=673940 RepID=A0ACB6RC75_9PLEO|nr:alpha/beta-hydrolase [Lindgomyces ingoldianus]KAF2476913.1 alpha/beta-hydrolase [Lindgomyces ingoldianus]
MIGKLAWRSFSFAYGVMNLAVMVAIAGLRDGAFTKRISEEERKELAIAQKKYWDLSSEPIPGFRHAFLMLKSGVKLHYVVNGPVGGAKGTNVAVFIHGFPDSFALWRALLSSPALQNHILVAVDLPGYGGSDSLQKYDAETILEAMAGFLLGMRELYLTDGGKMAVVTHDWGGIVGARLAAEAPQLADRWVIASSVLPQQTYSNILITIASARQMLHTWFRWPFNPRLLKTAFATLQPVLLQTACSFYVFILNLPGPIANAFARMGNFWFLRLLHWVQAGVLTADSKFHRALSTQEAADWMAMSTGPGPGQFPTSKLSLTNSDKPQQTYPQSVYTRIPDLGMSQKIRFYRENLILAPWEKSLETVVALSELDGMHPRRSSTGAGLFEDGPQGSLKAPATIVYGKQDPAFSPRLALDGIADYLVRGSKVVLIEKGGHWLPFEELGARVLERIVEWEFESLEGDMLGGLEEVKVMVEK